MNIRRILMSESEKLRILTLHENLKINNVNLLTEQDINSITDYFESQKKKYSNFPDGKVIPLTNGGFGYQTNNGIILYPDGSAYNAQGIKSVENWTDEPYVMTPVNQEITTQTPTTTTQTPTTIQPISFENLATEKELRQSGRQEAITRRKTARQDQRDKKTRVENCTEAINRYIKGNLGSKPDTDKTKQEYVNYLKTNCSGIDEIDLTIVGL